MNHTKIEWVKNPDGSQGYTWNPITGCNNQIDGMCQGGNFPCYAYRLANGRLRNRYLANKNTATHNYDEDCYPFYPRFWEDRLNNLPTLKLRSGRFSSDVRDALREKQRKGIFVCDMSDLFGIGIPEDWTRAVLSQCNKFWHHRFYLLTKQPQNLTKFSPFPDNCWVGVTATDAKSFLEAGRGLERIEVKVKYISFEPLLNYVGSLWLEDWLKSGVGIKWVIIGAQTKPYKPPKIEWVEEIVRACDKAGVPVFLKDNLKPLFATLTIIDCMRYPFWKEFRVNIEDDSRSAIRIRQEMPKQEE